MKSISRTFVAVLLGFVVVAGTSSSLWAGERRAPVRNVVTAGIPWTVFGAPWKRYTRRSGRLTRIASSEEQRGRFGAPPLILGIGF